MQATIAMENHSKPRRVEEVEEDQEYTTDASPEQLQQHEHQFHHSHPSS